jgi:hypothetical protein
LAVHRRHLELVFEVGDGAQPAHDCARTDLLGEVRQQAFQRGNPHIRQVCAAILKHLHALLQAEQRLLLRVDRDGDDEFVE